MRPTLPVALACMSLAACAGSPPPQQQAAPAAAPFTQALATEYRQFSQSEEMQADWTDSATFRRKAEQASAGRVPAPEDPAKRGVGTGMQLHPYTDIGKEQRAEVIQGRQRLLSALQDGAQRNPQAAARAQVAYDCWVEQLEEGWQRDDIDRCRNAFNTAMGQLEARPVAAAPAEDFQVFFPFDSAQLTNEGQNVIAQAARTLRQQQVPQIAVVGHADTSGANPYNDRLSQQRAQVVKDQLVAQGVPADRIRTEARGEGDPLVPTPDNVRQPENRRTVIEFD